MQHCKNLRVLYLYNNQIANLKGLEFGQNITHLYLQNNNITSIGIHFKSLKSLQKLYLDANCLQEVNGLENCLQLEELYISNQKIANDKHLILNAKSFDAIKVCSFRFFNLVSEFTHCFGHDRLQSETCYSSAYMLQFAEALFGQE